MHILWIAATILAIGGMAAFFNRPTTGRLIAEKTVKGAKYRALRTDDSAVYVVDVDDKVIAVVEPSIVKELDSKHNPEAIGLYAIDFATGE